MNADRIFKIATRTLIFFFVVVWLIATFASTASAQLSKSCKAVAKSKSHLVTVGQRNQSKTSAKKTKISNGIAKSLKKKRLTLIEEYGQGLVSLMAIEKKESWDNQGKGRNRSMGMIGL
jgi:hypothetical protein